MGLTHLFSPNPLIVLINKSQGLGKEFSVEIPFCLYHHCLSFYNFLTFLMLTTLLLLFLFFFLSMRIDHSLYLIIYSCQEGVWALYHRRFWWTDMGLLGAEPELQKQALPEEPTMVLSCER